MRDLRDLRAVLIDLDGTLIDRDAALVAWLRCRAGIASPVADELLALDRHHGRSLVALARALLHRAPELGSDPLALAERIRSELHQHIAPDPAVLAALDALAARGLALALISNGGAATQRGKLAAAGIDDQRFAAVLISAELGLAKPQRTIFDRALSSLATEPAGALMIGDSPSHDIAPAAALGLSTLWIEDGGPYPEKLPVPDARASSFAAAVELVCSRSPW